MNQKDKAINLLNQIFFNCFYDINTLKNLSIKILVSIDNLYSDITLINSLSFKISLICTSTDINNIYFNLIDELDNLFLLLHFKYDLFSPIVLKALNYINKSYAFEISLKAFSIENNINPSYFGRKFHSEVGISFSNYLNRKRIYKAKDLILKTNLNIREVSSKVGYLDISHFYKNFKKYFGISPAKYRYLHSKLLSINI